MQGEVDIVQAGEVGYSIGHACKGRLTLYRQVRWDDL